MHRPPRSPKEGVIDRRLLLRAWGLLGVVSAALVMAGFFWTLSRAGYREATTMTFAGIVACQIGTALAARTERASLRSVGFFSNRLLLWAILSEILFAAALIYLPPLQDLFGTAALGPVELAILATFPIVVWGADELRRARLRGQSIRPVTARA